MVQNGRLSPCNQAEAGAIGRSDRAAGGEEPAMESRVIHGRGGVGRDNEFGAVAPPIYQTSTFRQEGPGRHYGYEYARTGNPTRAALEELIAELEGGERGLAFASGSAALATVLMLLEAGDHVLCSEDVYGGTYRLLAQVFSRFGIQATFINTTDVSQVESEFTRAAGKKAGGRGIRMILVETPSNPLLRVSDLRAIASVAHRYGALLVVDNTFLTPYFQRPIALGADIVVHSATKYLGGHSDVVAGLVVAREKSWGERLQFLQNAVGAVLGPQDAWLVLRGIRTLAVRMERHAANALAIAEWLSQHPLVRRVYYPGLPSHPGHRLAREQATGFGGMVSFDVGDGTVAERIVTRTRLFVLAESLGGVESLICLPARMTHASLPPERRARLGITGGLIRLSVGLEKVDDLIGDLEQAMTGETARIERGDDHGH